MFALDRFSRLLCAGAALASFAAAFALTPLSAKGALTRAVPPASTSEPSADPTPVTPVEPRRDPFIAVIGDDPPVRVASTPVPQHIDIPTMSAPHLPLFPHLGPLPPNAGAGGGLVPPGLATSRIMAVANGPHPVALVSDGGHTHVVVVGDEFDHATVVHIGDDGIDLDDGRHIGVVPTTGSEGSK